MFYNHEVLNRCLYPAEHVHAIIAASTLPHTHTHTHAYEYLYKHISILLPTRILVDVCCVETWRIKRTKPYIYVCVYIIYVIIIIVIVFFRLSETILRTSIHFPNLPSSMFIDTLVHHGCTVYKYITALYNILYHRRANEMMRERLHNCIIHRPQTVSHIHFNCPVVRLHYKQ